MRLPLPYWSDVAIANLSAPNPLVKTEEERYAVLSEMADAFAELSPKLRLVAILALVEQVPYGEIADALGLSREAVKSRVFRASQRLRTTLEAKGITP